MNPWKSNSRALLGLLILLGLTITLAYCPLGWMHLPAALLVSLAKALLVVLIFMRLRLQGPVAVLAFAAGFFWLGILISLSLSDFLTRP